MQAVWNSCVQGKVLTTSPGSYRPRHTMQTSSVDSAMLLSGNESIKSTGQVLLASELSTSLFELTWA